MSYLIVYMVYVDTDCYNSSIKMGVYDTVLIVHQPLDL